MPAGKTAVYDASRGCTAVRLVSPPVLLQLLLQLELAQMHPEDLLPASDVWNVHTDGAVKAPWAQQRFVQNVGPVGACQNHHTCRKWQHVCQLGITSNA